MANPLPRLRRAVSGSPVQILVFIVVVLVLLMASQYLDLFPG